jgi:hypothetical protein
MDSKLCPGIKKDEFMLNAGREESFEGCVWASK